MFSLIASSIVVLSARGSAFLLLVGLAGVVVGLGIILKNRPPPSNP